MAQFYIDGHVSNGKRLDWLAYADEGETVAEVVQKVRLAAGFKFGSAVELKRWTHHVSRNGCITVQMHA